MHKKLIRNTVISKASYGLLALLILASSNASSTELFSDDFNRPDADDPGNGWGNAGVINNASNPTDNVDIFSNQLRISHTLNGTNQDGFAYRPFSQTCGIVISGKAEWVRPYASIGVAVNAGSSWFPYGFRLYLQPYPLPAIHVNNEGTPILAFPFALDLTTPYDFEWTIHKDCSTDIRIWKSNQSRPSVPTVATPPVTLSPKASPHLIAFASGGAGNKFNYPGYDVRIDDIVVSEQIRLTFPLFGSTPETARVTAIKDHHGAANVEDGVIEAYDGTNFRCDAGNPVVEFYSAQAGRWTTRNLSDKQCEKLAGNELSKPGLYEYQLAVPGPIFFDDFDYVYANTNYLLYDGHSGYDFDGAGGDPIRATADGVLCVVTNQTTRPTNGGQGYRIWRDDSPGSPCPYAADTVNSGQRDGWTENHTFYIVHEGDLSSWYLHSDHLSDSVSAQIDALGYAEVTRGQEIAYVGGYFRMNPNGVGTHLHFEVREDGVEFVDPYGYQGSPVLWE